MKYKDPRFMGPKRLTARSYEEFYAALGCMLAQISSYRMSTLHFIRASRPNGKRAGFYTYSPYALLPEGYEEISKKSLADARMYYLCADVIFEKARGQKMQIDVRRFANLLTFGHPEPLKDEEGEVLLDKAWTDKGYDALVWLRKKMQTFQVYTVRFLSPIEIRQEMFQGIDLIDWDKCKIPAPEPEPEPEQLAFYVDANGECGFGSEPLDAPKKKRERP